MTPGSATRDAEPYRRRLIGLPIQRSLFAGIDRSPEVLGLDPSAPGGRLEARLDDEGDLYLDRASAKDVADAFRAALTPQRIPLLKAEHASSCDALVTATERARATAAPGAPALDDRACRAAFGDLGARIEVLIRFGIVAKFVPDVVLAALREAGDDEPPPSPDPSPGRLLLGALAGLCLGCIEHGWPPERLAAAWPSVPGEVATLVRAFGREQAGFGPLPWDAPGYEDPAYTVSAMATALAGADAGALVALAHAIAPTPAAEGSALRAYLAFWLEFLERETWYVRRAFHVGMLPLLRRLAALTGAERPSDLLFHTIDELTRGEARPTEVEARRDRYLADEAYLTRHGIAPTRLSRLMEAA